MNTATRSMSNDAAEMLHGLIERWVSPQIVRSMHSAADAALEVERRNRQCDGYAGDAGASAPRCESYRGHPGPHFIRGWRRDKEESRP